MSILQSLNQTAWQQLAWQLSRPAAVDALIARAKRHPYRPIYDVNTGALYMDRGWIFNPYERDENDEQTDAAIPWLPSVRLHHICRADYDRHYHDHPWDARTIVLRGWYREERPMTTLEYFRQPLHQRPSSFSISDNLDMAGQGVWTRAPGYTGRLLHGQYHRITEVSPGGVWTLFFTWKYQGTWGFLVDGQKVPWREYLARKEAGEWA